MVLEGTGSYIDADGNRTPILEDALDGGEFRQEIPDYRAAPNKVERIAGTTDGWRATYTYPYTARNREGLDARAQKQVILNGNHAMGYGHPAVPPPTPPLETQIAESLAPGGPALDCANPASPHYAPKQANAVTTSDDEFVNSVSGSLKLGGTAANDIIAVSITLSDGDASTTDPTVDATELTSGSGDKGWSAEFARDAEFEGLADGTLTVSGTYTLGDGTTAPTSATKIIQKDTDQPAAPTATPITGAYNLTQSVTLNKAAGESPSSKIYYEVGNDAANTPSPDATSTLYTEQISVIATQTIKAVVIDEAGNPSDVGTFAYTIQRPTPPANAETPPPAPPAANLPTVAPGPDKSSCKGKKGKAKKKCKKKLKGQ